MERRRPACPRSTPRSLRPRGDSTDAYRRNRSVTISFRRAVTPTPSSSRSQVGDVLLVQVHHRDAAARGRHVDRRVGLFVERVVEPHDDAVAVLRALDRADGERRRLDAAAASPRSRCARGRGDSSARASAAGAAPPARAPRADAQSPACGMMLYVELVPARHLRARRPQLRPRAAAPRRDVGARQPADAAQQRHRDLRAARRVEHLVLRQAAVRDRQAVRAVVDATRTPSAGTCPSALPSTSPDPTPAARSAAATTPKCWSPFDTSVFTPGREVHAQPVILRRVEDDRPHVDARHAVRQRHRRHDALADRRCAARHAVGRQPRRQRRTSSRSSSAARRAPATRRGSSAAPPAGRRPSPSPARSSCTRRPCRRHRRSG